jgi:hypothetical protein
VPDPARVKTSLALRSAFVGLWLVIAGCSSPIGDVGEAMGGSPAEASQIVEAWIAEAQSGRDDLGWSRLYPSVRNEVFRSYEVYQEAVLASNWRRFHYVTSEVRTHDGAYVVQIRVPGGAESTPAFMIDWGMVQFPPVDGRPSDDGIISVRISPLGGDRGIRALGPG